MAVLNPTRAAGMTQAQIAAWNRANVGTGAAVAPPVVPVTAPTATPFSAPAPQMPPPPGYVAPPPPAIPMPKPLLPKPTGAVTGGTAPVGTLSPNQVAYDSFGNITAVGGKTPVPTTGTASGITGVATPPPAPQMPPPPTAQVTGGTAPISTATPLVNSPFPTAQAPQQIYQPNMGAGEVVQGYLDQLLSSNSPYIQNARRSGMEVAAQRGLLNSSIAAGASQRSAIEAAQPILNEINQLHNQREQLAFTGEQNQADRDQQITMARINDWAANNQFQREYNGQLSLIPITSVTALNNSLMQAAIENPEIFPPQIVSGLGEFFGTNLLSMLQQWFPSQYGGG